MHNLMMNHQTIFLKRYLIAILLSVLTLLIPAAAQSNESQPEIIYLNQAWSPDDRA